MRRLQVGILLSWVAPIHAEDVWTCSYNTAGVGGIGDVSPTDARGVKCVFPFTVGTVEYFSCTTKALLDNSDSSLMGGGSMTDNGAGESRIPYCGTAAGVIAAGKWGYCECPTAVEAPSDSTAANAVIAAVAGNAGLLIEYDTCHAVQPSTPCSMVEELVDGRRRALTRQVAVGSKPDITWKFGTGGYTIFTLDYKEVPYMTVASSTLSAGKINWGKWVNNGDNFNSEYLNEKITDIWLAFLDATDLGKVRAGCDTGKAYTECTGDDGGASLPPRCDPNDISSQDSRCYLDKWRVKVFAPYSKTNLRITVHVAPPAPILDRPATVIPRFDPRHTHDGPRGAKGGALQVSIAGGDWGYVCDETGTRGMDVNDKSINEGDFGMNNNGADIVCKQLYGLGATGQRLHAAFVPGAGEKIALERITCPWGTINTRGIGMGDAGAADSGLDPASGEGKENIPLALDVCVNVLPGHEPGLWGYQPESPTGDSPYLDGVGEGTPQSLPGDASNGNRGRRYPDYVEDCSDNEVANVMCTMPDSCNGHNLRSSANEQRQPTGFCQPPRGVCGPGEWEMPANGRGNPRAGAGHNAFHMGCCTGCPGGAHRCFHDCTCQCQTGHSCAEVQPMQKNCQTMVTIAENAGLDAESWQYKLGCRWDVASRGCIDFSASPTAAPTPKPTAWPTASPTKTQPPTAFPTAADCYVGGKAICVLGYYPLWCTQDAASKSSRDYQSRPITLGGVTYHMANIPPGGAWFGDYKGSLHGHKGTQGGMPEGGTIYGSPHAVVCITPGAAGPALSVSSCSDMKVGDAPWRDALKGTCAQYDKHAHWCEHFGGSRDHAFAGLTANKACCACGGGLTTSPTADPTADPTPPPPTPPPPPPPPGPCKWKSRDGVKKGKLGRDCTRKCPSGGRCRWCGSNGLCANSVCTCPDALFEPIPPKACLTKRASRKQGVPCLDACMKTRYWGELPAAARRGTCDWCGKGELCLREGAIHKCVCSPVTTERRAAVARLADEELEDEE